MLSLYLVARKQGSTEIVLLNFASNTTKRRTRMKIIAITLLWIISSTSCASSLTQLPSLKNRTLRFSKDGKSIIYQSEICKKKLLIFKKCRIGEVLNIPLTDTKKILELKTMGFKVKVIN
tara:strand:- start:5290 stop:5649 length:360 start_codon:yes stop_codon:yes gene_type:complete